MREQGYDCLLIAIFNGLSDNVIIDDNEDYRYSRCNISVVQLIAISIILSRDYVLKSD